MKWKETESSFELPPAGRHNAVCFRIIDLGTQENTYEGVTSLRRQVHLTWELTDETNSNGKNFEISKFYTMSLSDKSNLYQDLTSWLGKAPDGEFEADSLLGKGCELLITEKKNAKGQVRTTVNTVVGLKKGEKIAKPTNKLTILSLEPDEFDQDVFEALPEFFKKKIQLSPEYATIVSGGSNNEDDDDDDFGF